MMLHQTNAVVTAVSSTSTTQSYAEHPIRSIEMLEDSPSKRIQPRRRHIKRFYSFRTCREPATLAIILSALVLLAYSACIIGVVMVLDRQRVNTDIRQLEIKGEDVVSAEEPPSHHGDDLRIPKAQWPLTLRDEVDNYETIPHPVDPKHHFKVPKFWSPSIHNNKLMSRETAMKIGSCTVPDPNGSFARGADCPLHQRTIFIMIASYRDYQCRETIESIYTRAAHPERIRIGVVDQILDSDNKCNEPIQPCIKSPNQALCQYAHLIDTLTFDSRLSVGPVPARHIGHRMYRGEYYAVQSDAHVNFTNNWEMSLIHELESTGNEMAVMSTYLSDVLGAIDEYGDSIKEGRPIMCNSYWKKAQEAYHVHHSVQPECEPHIHGMPQLHPWWAAGFSFSRGHFVVNVPYDYYQPMVFSGEEMSIAIRGWTVGYDYYTPENSVCFHYYAESEEVKKKRANVPTFWENADLYAGSGVKGMRRLLAIVHMDPAIQPDSWDHTDKDIYGLGGVRTPEKLMSLLGIDPKHRTMEGHLCKFVRYQMHSLFMKHLRADGMGIDYSEIDYHWVDPENKKVDTAEAEKAEEEDSEEESEEEEKDQGKEAEEQ